MRDGQFTDDNMIWRMRCVCWIPKARIQTHTQNIYRTYCFSMAKMGMQKPRSVVFHEHCLSGSPTSCKIQFICKHCFRVKFVYPTVGTDPDEP